MTPTAGQIQELLESLSFVYDSSDDEQPWKAQPETGDGPGFSWHEFEEALYGDDPIMAPGLGLITPLVVDGGGEGAGEHCELVFKLTADDGTDRFFKKEGYYASFHGTDWDGDFFEVKPALKTITVYPRVES